jgi:hypothetical protein
VNTSTWRRAASIVVCVGLIASAGSGFAHQPAPARPVPAQVPPAGLGGIPAVSGQQMAALAKMTTDLTPLIQAAVRARDELVAATFALPRNDAAIRARTDAIRVAERALANARADAFAAIQRSPGALAPNQVAGLIATGGSLLRTGAGRGGNPGVTAQQRIALAAMTAALTPLTQTAAAARTELVATSLAVPRNDAAIEGKLEAVVAAEQTLGGARADAFAAIQKSANILTPDQVAALITLGGTYRTAGLAFTEPDPVDFDDHEGYVSLFDGVSLKGWDGNPKFWRVEDGAMIGESTVENPSGNSYIAYRDIEAKDFTLKLEIKIEGSGGSGIQYRSKTGVPWLGNIPANVGPVNLNWMMTGPQADFWPSTPVYTGQFYSENTPMRILAWRGQVVEGFGSARKRLMGTIGDREALGNFVKMNDWNAYTIIARGGTFIHVLNGQLMAVMIDDDPGSSNNQSGQIGIEIEAITKVFVRNIWLKKVN